MSKNEGIMENNIKKDRFKRVAEKRVQRVIDSIRVLSNCSNKRMYEWEDHQLRKIWAAIDQELKSCKAKFENSKPQKFKL